MWNQGPGFVALLDRAEIALVTFVPSEEIEPVEAVPRRVQEGLVQVDDTRLTVSISVIHACHQIIHHPTVIDTKQYVDDAPLRRQNAEKDVLRCFVDQSVEKEPVSSNLKEGRSAETEFAQIQQRCHSRFIVSCAWNPA